MKHICLFSFVVLEFAVLLFLVLCGVIGMLLASQKGENLVENM